MGCYTYQLSIMRLPTQDHPNMNVAHPWWVASEKSMATEEGKISFLQGQEVNAKHTQEGSTKRT